MAKILIVEDDDLLCKGLAFGLQKDGHDVFLARSCEDGHSAYLCRGFDMVLLDINLPDKGGDVLCSEIRNTSGIPVVFITANDTDQDIIKGFQLGCDDYISKPFSIDVLRQRINAVLRRTGPADRNIFKSGDITIDFQGMTVKKGEQCVKLTATEYRLLEVLAKNKGQVMTREILLEKLWDSECNFVDENALSVNIRRLRLKIEDDPQDPVYIATVFGIGYTWGE